jgi:hypothetical protein
MKVILTILAALSMFFLISRVNELHDKVDAAGAVLKHATAKIDEASEIMHQKLQAKEEADKKIDEVVKDIPADPPVVEPDMPPAPSASLLTPPVKHRHRKGPVYK